MLIPSRPNKKQLVDAIQDNVTIAGNGISQFNSSLFVPRVNHARAYALLVAITNTGPQGTESDFPDDRYWAIVQQNTTTNSQYHPIDPVNVQARNISGKPQIIVVHNPPDILNKSHSLPQNTLVTVVPIVFDQPKGGQSSAEITSTTLIRWVVSGGGGALPVGQYQGQGLYMVSDNQSGFSDTFLIQGP